jgi:O-methyltransferase
MKSIASLLKSIIKGTARCFGFTIVRERRASDKINSEPIKTVTDAELYCPLYSPWLSKDFQSYCLASLPYTLVSADRLWVLYSLARQALAVQGEFIECGVYKGGTALLLAKIIGGQNNLPKKTLHLFDTFQGMPEVNTEKDFHRKGDFSDTSLETVRSRLAIFPWTVLHPGTVPSTFQHISGTKICFAHVDVDIYESVFSCCERLYPQMTAGGIMIFDDYGFPTCPGAREAVDKWFSDKPEVPLVLPTGQAVIFKLPSSDAFSRQPI